jgi:hypothetical protein
MQKLLKILFLIKTESIIINIFSDKNKNIKIGKIIE